MPALLASVVHLGASSGESIVLRVDFRLGQSYQLVGRSIALWQVRHRSQNTILHINRTQLIASSTNHTRLVFSRAVLDAEDCSEKAFLGTVASMLGSLPLLESSFTF